MHKISGIQLLDKVMARRCFAMIFAAVTLWTPIYADNESEDPEKPVCHTSPCYPCLKDSRPVTGVYGIEFGRESAYSTYLSPLTYSGPICGIYGNWSKALPFSPEHAIMEFGAGVSYGSMLNSPQTARMLDLDLSLSWGMAWRKRFASNRWQVTAGGQITIGGGLLWLTRNGNNPVAARSFPNIAAKGSLARCFKIGRLPIIISDELKVPLAGLFFSPEYGETYYEIYLGNHSGFVHFGWPGNHFTLSNLLSVNLDLGRTAMQIGYRITADTSWICGINTHIYRHSLVIGVIPGGLGLKQKKNADYAWY